MKVILYNAISIDGFIATKDGNSDWVSESDWPNFEKAMNEAGCIIIGRKTYEQYKGELYPVQNLLNIVLTHNSGKLEENPNLVVTNKNLNDALEIAKSRNYESVLLVGGGNLNASFLKENLIDEIILTIHPLILGDGIKLFESDGKLQHLERKSTHEMSDGLVQIIYRVKK